MKRGPKSSAELSVVTPIGASRPQPPGDISDDQAAIWRSIVDRLPQDWFPRETHEVLAAYCRHVTSHRFLTKMIAACEAASLGTDDALKDYDRVLAMRDRETKAMIAAARSLRITKSSQMRSEAASRRARDHAGGPRPWEESYGGGRG